MFDVGFFIGFFTERCYALIANILIIFIVYLIDKNMQQYRQHNFYEKQEKRSSVFCQMYVLFFSNRHIITKPLVMGLQYAIYFELIVLFVRNSKRQ